MQSLFRAEVIIENFQGREFTVVHDHAYDYIQIMRGVRNLTRDHDANMADSDYVMPNVQQ